MGGFLIEMPCLFVLTLEIDICGFCGADLAFALAIDLAGLCDSQHVRHGYNGIALLFEDRNQFDDGLGGGGVYVVKYQYVSALHVFRNVFIDFFRITGIPVQGVLIPKDYGFGTFFGVFAGNPVRRPEQPRLLPCE